MGRRFLAVDSMSLKPFTFNGYVISDFASYKRILGRHMGHSRRDYWRLKRWVNRGRGMREAGGITINYGAVTDEPTTKGNE